MAVSKTNRVKSVSWCANHAARVADRVPAPIALDDQHGVGIDFAFFLAVEILIEGVAATLALPQRTGKYFGRASGKRQDVVTPALRRRITLVIVVRVNANRQAQLLYVVDALDRLSAVF